MKPRELLRLLLGWFNVFIRPKQFAPDFKYSGSMPRLRGNFYLKKMSEVHFFLDKYIGLIQFGHMTRTNDQKPRFPVKRFQDNLEGKEGQILFGAFQSIVEIGIASTTIRGIAAKAGVNPGIIHYYFKSKDDLLSRVLEICYQNSIANIEALFATDLSPIEKVESLFDLGLSLFKYRRDEWIVIASFWAHSMSGHSDMLRLHQKLNRRFQAAMIKLLKKTTGESRPGISKDIAFLLIGTMEGLALQYVLDPKGFEPKRAVNLLRELLLKAL